MVADTLSRKEVNVYITALSEVVSDFNERIKLIVDSEASYEKLRHQVRDGLNKKYWIEDELLVAKGGRLYVPIGNLGKELLRETHDIKGAGLPGEERTLALLARSYYWPKMEDDIHAYVQSCLVCQLDKTERKKISGLLLLLLILEKPWESISMDFISEFPKVSDCLSIFVVFNRFSKYAMFIPAPEACLVEEEAGLFYSNVVRYFGFPKDRDAKFTGKLWVELFKLLSSKLKFSTANHSQIDGQTERVNA